MAKPPSLIGTSFNAGEIGPRMYGRVDQEAYRDGLAICENFVPMIQGPVLKAPGTIFVEHPKAQCRLIEFVPFVTQAYMIEASLDTFRFYTGGFRLETSPGVAYEVAHPYTLAEIQALDYQRSGDVTYLLHPAIQQAKLSRTGAQTFTYAQFDFMNGPFDDGNSDQTITVEVSGTTGSGITVTSNTAIFLAGHVGGLFQIEALDFSVIEAWEPGYGEITIGMHIRSDGKVYQCTDRDGGTGHFRTGTIQPTHTEGEEWDGMSGNLTTVGGDAGGSCKWLYLYDRFGVVKITGYTSPTVVTADVTRRLCETLTTVPSWRWSYGAFSDAEGWPSSAAIWDDRLVLAKDSQLFGSVIGDYENFAERDDSGELTPDMSFRVRLPDPNPIQWIRADKDLLIGAADAEYAATVIQNSSIPQINRQSKYGSGAVRPVEASSRLLFVQRAGKKIREMAYSFQTDRYEAPDLTVIADHMGAPGFLELAFQQEPNSLVWERRGDGTLALTVYSPTQAVRGWARRILGGAGFVEAIATMPNPAGDADEVWLSVLRGSVRAIERMSPFWETGDDQETAFFVDCGASYALDVPATVFTGIPHLAGIACKVLADGAPHPDVTVAMDGSFTLASAASNVAIGYGYDATLKTLRPEINDSNGTAQGRMKRIPWLTLRVLETLGISVTVQGGDQTPVELRGPTDLMDQAVPLFTGDIRLDCIGEFDRDGYVEIVSDQPLPACILAIIPAIAMSPQ